MNNQEYEHKKAECWHEYFSADKRLTTTHEHELTKDAFYAAFDRAYALGKQEKEAEDDKVLKVSKQLFCRLCADADDYINEHLEEDDSDYGYYQGRSDALHELYPGELKDADTVIQGWVARDDGERWHERELHLFTRNKPERRKLMGDWMGRPSMTLDSNLFPDLTWESDPIEVEIIIKRKKK